MSQRWGRGGGNQITYLILQSFMPFVYFHILHILIPSNDHLTPFFQFKPLI